jgi:EcoEI R protein C-terminal
VSGDVPGWARSRGTLPPPVIRPWWPSAFSRFLSDRSLTTPQIRFVETVIDQLTGRGVMEASALYEPPFSDLHAEGPDALFEGKGEVIEGIFEVLEEVSSVRIVDAG